MTQQVLHRQGRAHRRLAKDGEGRCTPPWVRHSRACTSTIAVTCTTAPAPTVLSIPDRPCRRRWHKCAMPWQRPPPVRPAGRDDQHCWPKTPLRSRQTAQAPSPSPTAPRLLEGAQRAGKLKTLPIFLNLRGRAAQGEGWMPVLTIVGYAAEYPSHKGTERAGPRLLGNRG